MSYEELIRSTNRPISTIPEEENQSAQNRNWDEWSTYEEDQAWWNQCVHYESETEAGPNPGTESIRNIICNALTIEQGFNPFEEFPYLFPEKTLTGLQCNQSDILMTSCNIQLIHL